MIFALTKCRYFEYANILQCNKCMRFGHFARECPFDANYRKCGDAHESIDYYYHYLSPRNLVRRLNERRNYVFDALFTTSEDRSSFINKRKVGGGVVILIKNNITYTEIDIGDESIMEYLAVRITIDDVNICLINCYVPPYRTKAVLIGELST